MVVVVIPNPFGFDRSVVGDGTGFILSCVDFGRIFDDSFPTYGFVCFFQVEHHFDVSGLALRWFKSYV